MDMPSDGTTRKRRVIFAVAGAVGLAAAWFTLSRLKTIQAETVRAAGEVQNLKQSVRELAETQTRPTLVFEAPRPERAIEVAASAPIAAVAPVAPSAATASDPLAGLDPEEKHYRLGVINEAQTKLVGYALEHELPDPKWAKGAVELIRSTYSGEEFVGVNITADCKSTLCKVSLSSTDALQGEKALRQMLEKQPWPSNGFAHFDREKQEGYVYLAREGTEIPRVDPATLTY